MDLRELKESIDNKTFKPRTFIMSAKDKFLPLMYLEAIGLNYDINYIESFDLLPRTNSIFEFPNLNNIYVIIKEKVDFIPDFIYNYDNVIIVCSNIDSDMRKSCRCDIIDIPLLEEWQIKDMVYSFCQGIEESKLNWMMDICDNNRSPYLRQMYVSSEGLDSILSYKKQSLHDVLY